MDLAIACPSWTDCPKATERRLSFIRYKYGDLLAFIDLQKRENTSQK